jgi:YVTN family beta-propeller protein
MPTGSRISPDRFNSLQFPAIQFRSIQLLLACNAPGERTVPADKLARHHQTRGNRLPMLAVLLLLLPLLSACQPLPAEVRPLADTEGEVFLYLAPLPQGADRLRFTLAGVAAVREDGTSFPLRLQLSQVTDNGARGARLLASGRLPAGEYLGLAVSVEQATLQTDDGEKAALLLPEETVSVEDRFSLPRQGALLLEMAYRHEGAIRLQFEFVPTFSAYRPERPVATRIAFAAQAGASHLTVFDRKAMRVTGVLPTDAAPTAIAVDARTRRAYVAFAGEDALVALDVSSGAPIGRLPLQAGDRPADLALTADGRLLLVANAGADLVSFVDTASLTEIFRLPVGDEPRSLLIDRAGQLAYLFNYRGNSISILHLGRREIVTTLGTDPGPVQGAFNRDGSRMYVLHRDSPYLTVIDVATLAVRERLLVGRGGRALLVDPRTDLLYLGMEDEARIHVIDPFSLLAVDYLPLPGTGAMAMQIDDEENALLVALAGTPQVVAIDLIGKRITATLETPHEVQTLEMMGERR